MQSNWKIHALKYSGHALKQMFERKISPDDVRLVVDRGDLIADYPNDVPSPTRLLLGFAGNRPLHIVLGYNALLGEGIVITAYEPDPKVWEPGFRSRKSL